MYEPVAMLQGKQFGLCGKVSDVKGVLMERIFLVVFQLYAGSHELGGSQANS